MWAPSCGCREGVRAMLQTGDPCPCCGRPIKSEDPEVLALLTLIRDSMALAEQGGKERVEDARAEGEED